jgi:hypothetical protein
MSATGNTKEVRYMINYSEQLQHCAKIFFGSSFEEYSAILDENSLLEETLSNMTASEGDEGSLKQVLSLNTPLILRN